VAASPEERSADQSMTKDCKEVLSFAFRNITRGRIALSVTGTSPDRAQNSVLRCTDVNWTLKADSYIACRAAKGLECVFPLRFTQRGRVWFTLATPRPCHSLTMPFFSRPQHNTALSRRACCAGALRRTAWLEHGMASVNQTRPHCVHQMGNTHSKPLAARHGRGMGTALGTACYVWIGLNKCTFETTSIVSTNVGVALSLLDCVLQT